MGSHLLSAFLLSISSNIDSFAVAIAYGVKQLRIGFFANLLIAIVSSLGTFVSMSIGQSISSYLPQNIANLLGSGVLVAIGSWGIWEALYKRSKRKSKLHREKFNIDSTVKHEVSSRSSLDEISYESFLDNPEKADKNKSGDIDVREAIALALGLTINNLGSGVGGGISGLNIPFTTSLTFFLAIAAVLVGYFLGEKFAARMAGIWPEIVSGVLIILIAVYEYFS